MAKKKTNPHKKSHSHNHLHIIIVSLSVIAVVFGYFLFNMTSSAKEKNLDYQGEIAKKQCDTKGKPVINITQKVINSVDSGEGGNNWALDTYNRRIQVWKQKNATYCALVDYTGKFDSVAGQQSPGNTSPLTGKEDGTFKGGYRAVISGALKTPADWNTYGNVGTYDYKCDISGNCPAAFNWMDKYFNTSATGFTSTLNWWGWTYKYKNKTWINSSDGNSGDII